MGRITNGMRKDEAITDIADIYALASAEKLVAPPAVPLDLKPLISPYRRYGRFTLRIENLPQSARLSAGQNNGDRTWSLALDELDDLFYFPPAGIDNEHTLAIRVITKDDTGASTIALIDYRITGAIECKSAVSSLPQRITRKSDPIEIQQDETSRKETSFLKEAIAERDLQLKRLRASSEQINTHLEERLDAALAEAEKTWRGDEALRLNALESELQVQFERKLAVAMQRAKGEAKGEEEAFALQNVQRELATAKNILATREAELTELQRQIERLRQASKSELLSEQQGAEAKGE